MLANCQALNELGLLGVETLAKLVQKKAVFIDFLTGRAEATEQFNSWREKGLSIHFSPT